MAIAFGNPNPEKSSAGEEKFGVLRERLEREVSLKSRRKEKDKGKGRRATYRTWRTWG